MKSLTHYIRQHSWLCLQLTVSAWRAMPVALVLSVVPAFCRADTITSPLTGLELPAGAQRVQSQTDLAQARPVLEKMAQTSGKSIGRMEAYHWTQKEGVQTHMDKTLTQSADLYKKFPSAEQNGAKLDMFVMAIKARKVACVGMWLQSGTDLYLAWAEIVSADPKPTPAPPNPENTDRTTPASHTPVFPKLARKPGIIQGTVLDSSGRPMPDVTVSTSFTFPSPYLSPADVMKSTTDAHGHYSINVKEAVAVGHIFVTRRVQYNGMSCPLRFRRYDANGKRRDSDIISRTEGDVVNFMTALTGLQETDADPENWAYYFGSLIEVSNDTRNNAHHALPAGSRVRLALTPVGPLLDGSPGHVIVQDVLLNYTSINYKWLDIPIGRYLLTATLLQPNGTAVPLQATARIRIKGIMNSFPMNANTPLFFPPSGENSYDFVCLDIIFP